MKKALLASVALLIGGMIYVLWRSEALLMFIWFDALGMRPAVEILRGYAAPYSTTFPSWFYFSLPQALWLFSGILLFDSVWRGDARLHKWFWVIVVAVSAIGGEFAQHWRFLPGTFDLLDIILCILALTIAILCIHFSLSTERRFVR